MKRTLKTGSNPARRLFTPTPAIASVQASYSDLVGTDVSLSVLLARAVEVLGSHLTQTSPGIEAAALERITRP
ncbi:Exported protein of unknown function [Magnetospira sp. QH-2]|nr:Exported protein of unknown function [Magnetospira sp. QH-2]